MNIRTILFYFEKRQQVLFNEEPVLKTFESGPAGEEKTITATELEIAGI